MPDAQPPATPEQVNNFLKTILPIIEKEYVENLALFDSAVANNVGLRLLAQIDASMSHRAFLDRINLYDSYGHAWSQDFVRWCLYVLGYFVVQPVEMRLKGLVYRLPKGLLPRFEAIDPTEREHVLDNVSRSQRLQISQMDGRTDVLVFRQVG